MMLELSRIARTDSADKAPVLAFPIQWCQTVGLHSLYHLMGSSNLIFGTADAGRDDYQGMCVPKVVRKA
jgi:hypothetical protein